MFAGQLWTTFYPNILTNAEQVLIILVQFPFGPFCYADAGPFADLEADHGANSWRVVPELPQ